MSDSQFLADQKLATVRELMKKLEPSDRSNTHQLQNCKLCLTEICFSCSFIATGGPSIRTNSIDGLVSSAFVASLPRNLLSWAELPLLGHTS